MLIGVIIIGRGVGGSMHCETEFGNNKGSEMRHDQLQQKTVPTTVRRVARIQMGGQLLTSLLARAMDAAKATLATNARLL